jgi:hypothetical protein
MLIQPFVVYPLTIVESNYHWNVGGNKSVQLNNHNHKLVKELAMIMKIAIIKSPRALVVISK